MKPSFALFFSLFIHCAVIAQTRNGLDPTFGDQGVVYVQGPSNIHGFAESIAVQADGRIVAGGTLGAVRFLANGAIDETFADKGIYNFPADTPGSGASTFAVYPQRDLKVVLVRDLNYGYCAVTRLDRFGKVDSSFGHNGITLARVGWHQQTAMQEDGKLLVCGYDEQGAVVRIKQDGSIDSAFGTDGFIYTDGYDAPLTFLDAIACEKDGNFLIGTSGWNADSSFAGNLLRYSERGIPDTAFNRRYNTHAVLHDFNGFGELRPQGDGKVIFSTNVVSSEGMLCRINKNGSLDTTYGVGGLYKKPKVELFSGLRTLPNNDIIAITNLKYSLIKVRADGNAADTSFGSGGFFGVTLKNEVEDKALALALQPDGKILVAGTTYDSVVDNFLFTVVRYFADGRPAKELPTGNLRIYPNPVKNMLNIDFAQVPSAVSMSVWTIDGRLVMRTSLNLQHNTVSFGSMPVGTYALRLLGDEIEKTVTITKY